MPATRFDVISIGTLGRNRLWNESEVVRTAHSTTTLIRAGDRNILVDPGLPAPALAARLNERTGLRPDAIDTVFLTSFRPHHRAGLSLFASAKILIHETEQQAARQHLEEYLHQAPQDDQQPIEQDLKLLEQLQPAPDQFAQNVDLFPLFGCTPGNCGLLIALPTLTVLVTGDAVVSQEHFLAGQVPSDCFDIQIAHAALAEVYEIADLIIPGADNVFMNPRTHGI
jgi:glyoxylase-like metal-dependent hydrolase (beta-lactamase superfamily II)